MYIIAALLFLSSGAFAQDYSVSLGVNRTDAQAGSLGAAGPVSVDGKLNFRIGGGLAYEFQPAWRLRTGLEYVQRHIAWNRGTNGVAKIDLEYLDVPLNAQYNFTPMIGVFGGLKAAFKISDKVRYPDKYSFDLSAESIISLFDLGVAFNLDDLFGVEAYYERSFGGEFAYRLSEFSEGGVRVAYIF